LIATYRLLASLVLERGADGQEVEVEAWEWPWVREVCSAIQGKFLRVRMPAGAMLRAREPAVDSDRLRDHLTQVLLIPDLGTAPVVRCREMLRRLVALREAAGFADGSADAEPELVIATRMPTVPGHGAAPGWSCLIGSDVDTESIRCGCGCSPGTG
jgi:hypothetical protein